MRLCFHTGAAETDFRGSAVACWRGEGTTTRVAIWGDEILSPSTFQILCQQWRQTRWQRRTRARRNNGHGLTHGHRGVACLPCYKLMLDSSHVLSLSRRQFLSYTPTLIVASWAALISHNLHPIIQTETTLIIPVKNKINRSHIPQTLILSSL